MSEGGREGGREGGKEGGREREGGRGGRKKRRRKVNLDFYYFIVIALIFSSVEQSLSIKLVGTG